MENLVGGSKKLACVLILKIPKAIAEAIEYLRTNPEIAREMGERGKQLILEKFNWSVEEEKLVHCYKSLLGYEN